MKKIKVAMIGGGKRSTVFMRAAKGVPEVFDITAVWMRNPEKAREYAERMGVPTVTELDDLLATKPDFVIVCLPRAIAVDYIEMMYKIGMPVLCETPPGANVADLTRLWELTKQYNGKIQVSEQYFVWPLFSAWLKVVHEGMIGDVSNITLSSLHGYHGTNIIRNFLDIKGENCKIYGKAFPIPVVDTNDYNMRIYNGEVITPMRQRLTFEFENGKYAFFDFTNVQYRSDIRTRQLNVQGTRGEIDDMTVRYLNQDNEVITQSLFRDDRGVYNIWEWAHFGLQLGDRYLYKSPFPTARVNDDELALATLLYKMKDFVEKGEAFYPLEEALQDSYLALVMQDALDHPNEEIQTETQAWYL